MGDPLNPTPPAGADYAARAEKLANASLMLAVLASVLPLVGTAILDTLGFHAQWRPPMVGASWPVSTLPFAGTTVAALLLALAAMVTGQLAITRAGGTLRSLFGALVGSIAVGLFIVFLVGWRVHLSAYFIGVLVFPPLVTALAAFFFVRLARRSKRVPQTGTATWRPVVGALFTYAALTLIALVALSAFGKGRHSWENAICQNNLKLMAIVLRQYAHETKGSYFPPLPSQPGVLMFSPDAIADITIRSNVEIQPSLTCPTARFADQPATGPATPFDDQSYFYLGYAVLNDGDVEAFAKAYRQRIAEGRPFDDDLVVETGGTARVLHRLRDGIEGVLIAEGAGGADDGARSARVGSEIPLLIERNQGGHIEYPGNPPIATTVGHVLYLSGDVRRVPSGTWPMTEKTQRILAELAQFPPIPAPE